MRKRFSLLAALTLVVGLMSLLFTPAQAADKQCSDFGTQAEAQRFYVDNVADQRVPHQLDSDSDGKACEGSACPCLDATSGDGDAAAVSIAERARGVRARVVEVDDGDTLKVRLTDSGGLRNVRLIGIDTPEVHGHDECGGAEASRSLRRMLPPGQVVRLVSDPVQDNRDLFNRLLRYVVKPDGRDVGRKQLRRGWARVFIFGGDSFERVESYRGARKLAKRRDRGTWGIC